MDADLPDVDKDSIPDHIQRDSGEDDDDVTVVDDVVFDDEA